jgi:hypothetical protein
MLWKIMIAVGVFLILATFAVMVWFIFYMPKPEPQWEIEALKYNGPGQQIERGWEPFCFDSKTNTLFIRRKVEEVE